MQKDNIFLTEKDIDYLRERLREDFLTKDEFRQYRSELFDKLDKILGEILASRQEQTVLSHRQSEHSDQLGDHENRITLLETPKTS